ncbi:MAG: mannose-6-phosphate isomerase, class I [Microbacterium sp.]|uniref:mannose-6-phosphate isomerase, class I n=1 Tax=Microbacterium sp. TaxID=51671 RepID=UPI0039E61F1B
MLLRLSNTPRDYAWGSTTLIAELEGREPATAPEAELWLGDHPGAPATVEDGSGRTLDRWLDDHAPGTRLPYLLKLIAIAHPLSIQAHPSKAQGESGFAREEAAGIPRDAPERSYRDDNHKPELLVAASERVRALAGLRETARTQRLLSALGEAAGVRELRERLEKADAAGRLGDVVAWLLSPAACAAVADVRAALPTASSDEFADELAVARWLDDEMPGDPGVLVALLMNLVMLRRGEGLYVPAGVLHAYVDGLGVEIMAASDNVLRGGLTTKHVDVDELAAVLDPSPGAPPVMRPVALAGAIGDVAVYAAPCRDFELARVRVAAGSPAQLVPRGISIALALAGTVAVAQGGQERALRPGQALLATDAALPLRVAGDGELFLAQPGRRIPGAS